MGMVVAIFTKLDKFIECLADWLVGQPSDMLCDTTDPYEGFLMNDSERFLSEEFQ